jgi:hypothetical protein
MKVTNFFSLKWGQPVYTVAKRLDNEANTAWIETKTVERDGTAKSVRGLIEVVRSRAVYTVQYAYTHDTQPHVTSTLASFRFGT